MADKPVTREEKYLAYLTGDYKGELPKPITRKEKYLYELCLKGIGGEISPEEIKAAVNEYLEKNPIKPGATTEQAQQIEQNKTDIVSLKTDISTKITKFYKSNQGGTHIADSDNGKIMDMMIYGKSSQDGTPTPENPVEIKSVMNPMVKVTNEDGLKVQSVTLNNITLNAIPVSSGGNVTIDGQQYIADYVDVERGRVVRNIENATFNGAENENWVLWNVDNDKIWSFMFQNSVKTFVNESASKCNRFEFDENESIDRTFWLCKPNGNPSLQIKNRIIGKDITAFKSWLSNNPIDVIYPLRIPIEEELTAEHAQALKELATYYPVTNISIGSEQLDGYTVFNYPTPFEDEWNKTQKEIGGLKAETGSLKEDISNKITKFYASSQGENHLADSDNGKIQDMMVYGKSEQKQYSGKNLLKLSEVNVPKYANGLLTTINADGSISVTGTSTSNWSNITKLNNECHTDNATYTFSVDKNPDIVIGLKLGRTELDDANYQTHRIMRNQLSYTFKTGASNEYCSLFLEGLTAGKSYNFTIYPMLELGTEATSYEPYTGGIPSPNPDYPQEIKSVVNPTVKIVGKNLFDSKKFSIILNRAIDTNTGAVYESLSGKYCATEKYIPFPYSGKKISFNASMSLCAYDQDYKFISSVNKNNGQVPSGTMYVRFDIKIEDKDKVQIELSENTTTYEPYHEQTVTLPYTLNAIPVSSGGNVTIDGQQYIADYVDAEHGKLVKMVDSSKLDNTQSIVNKTEWLLAEPQETDLTTEEITAFKALATYYPVTNISINSEQLDGYTVFNYPISMKNGWDYVKQQLNDNRDYIYDMDIQSAEAYVNSEYAVALTELEV